jgi:mono/diheme cytochrome c family protein
MKRIHLAAPLLLLLTACPRLDPMWEQPKVEPYQRSDFFADGRGMREPPPGTVPNQPLLDATLLTGAGPDGKPLATLPVEVTAVMLGRGRAKYDIHCAVCHGLLGDGQSQIALSMSLRKPPSLHDYRGVPDGHLFQVVTNGFGLMGSYASELSVQDRWAVVAYVRALQLSQHASVDQVPPEARERLDKEGR